MSTDKIRAYNQQLKQLINSRDLQNPDLKKLVKIQKVNLANSAYDLQRAQPVKPAQGVPNRGQYPITYSGTFAELNLFYCLVTRATK